MKVTINVVFLFVFSSFFAQNTEGYWDTMRATSETVVLKAGERKIIKTNNLPEGTSEVVYRFSILDDNQKITSSLVSVLKAIPDPSGISQGSAGAVLLLSTISGDDKCKYAIFGNENEANDYQLTGTVKPACYIQNSAVNKEAKLLSTNSKCFSKSPENLWFGFESTNWVMKQKIVLEVVPWVSYKLQRGWTNEAKKEVISICNKLEVQSMIENKERFTGCFLDFIVTKYTYKDFKNLLPEERNAIIEECSVKALQLSKEDIVVSASVRKKADDLFVKGKEKEAIEFISKNLIDKRIATAIDFNTLGKYLLLTHQYNQALELLQKTAKSNPTDLSVQLNLAHSYMLTDNLKAAKFIHEKYKSQNISTSISWKNQAKSDFELFRSRDIETKGFKKILKALN